MQTNAGKWKIRWSGTEVLRKEDDTLDMRRPYKIPIIFLLVVAGAFLLVKGLMYLRVKSMVDDFVQQASDSAEVTYSGISTELTGGASVEGIRIRPLPLEQAVEIDRVHFTSDDPWALITGGDWREDPPPEQMKFALYGVRVALDDQLIEAMEAQQPAVQAGAAAGETACLDGFNIDPRMLRELGFDELLMDAHMAYQFDVPDERLNATVGFDLMHIESAEMSVELSGVVPQDVQQQRLTAPSLASAEMRVEVSRNFGERYMELCAKLAGKEPEAYRDALLDRMQQELASTGVTLGAGLRQAMADLYTEWGELRIRMRPAEPLGPMQMLQMGPQNIVDTLGISLRVNDRPVTDLSFDFDMQELLRQAQGGAGAQQEGPGSAAPQPKRVRITRHYERVPLGSLEDHIGASVKIKPVGQPLRSGQLVAITAGEAQIRQLAHGGSFTSHVPLREIESLEVQVVERQTLD